MTDPTEPVTDPGPRRRFGPTLVSGLAGAALCAVGSARTLVTARSDSAGGDRLTSSLAFGPDAGQLPLATTLALVVLAAWGVVLVTRRRVRRAAAVIGGLAALGVLATVVSGWWLLPETLRDDAAAVGIEVTATSLTGWYWLTLLAAAVSAAASLAAVAWVGRWPEMGSRYDAPGTREGEDPTSPGDGLALWKALDEGRDPSA